MCFYKAFIGHKYTIFEIYSTQFLAKKQCVQILTKRTPSDTMHIFLQKNPSNYNNQSLTKTYCDTV